MGDKIECYKIDMQPKPLEFEQRSRDFSGNATSGFGISKTEILTKTHK